LADEKKQTREKQEKTEEKQIKSEQTEPETPIGKKPTKQPKPQETKEPQKEVPKEKESPEPKEIPQPEEKQVQQPKPQETKEPQKEVPKEKESPEPKEIPQPEEKQVQQPTPKEEKKSQQADTPPKPKKQQEQPPAEKKKDKKDKDKKPDDFQYIVRIANADINGDYPLELGLAQIKGIGRRLACLIADSTGIKRSFKMGNLSDKQIEKIKETLMKIDEIAPAWMLNHRKDIDTGENQHIISGEVELRLRDDVNLLKMIRSYRGIRHESRLPVRGQRTRANNRTGLTLGVSKKKL
jgi:small subunit ribosomal protein S13